MNFGLLRHRVTLANPSAPTGDGDGGAARRWPPEGGVVLGTRLPASVEPVTKSTLDRQVAETTQGVETFTVRVRYLRGVTLLTRVTFHDGPTDRTLWISGINDEAQRHEMLALTCAEQVA